MTFIHLPDITCYCALMVVRGTVLAETKQIAAIFTDSLVLKSPVMCSIWSLALGQAARLGKHGLNCPGHIGVHRVADITKTLFMHI